jgi:hypothetical protein
MRALLNYKYKAFTGDCLNHRVVFGDFLKLELVEHLPDVFKLQGIFRS